MDLSSLRTLSLSLVMAAHGVSATVTRPAPDSTPVSTTGLWLTTPQDEAQPYGVDISRRDPRRVLVLPRADLSSVPRGTSISAPEVLGGAAKTWRVDGIDQVQGDHWRVLVVPA